MTRPVGITLVKRELSACDSAALESGGIHGFARYNFNTYIYYYYYSCYIARSHHNVSTDYIKNAHQRSVYEHKWIAIALKKKNIQMHKKIKRHTANKLKPKVNKTKYKNHTIKINQNNKENASYK